MNHIDANGLKQGYWIISGEDMPEKGFPVDGKIEEGNYRHNRKTGVWTMYHTDGITPRMRCTFVDGRPNGPYQKIYKNGNLAEVGNYSFGKQRGWYITFYESGCVKLEKYFNESGNEEGLQCKYNDDCDTIRGASGTVEFELEKENGMIKSLDSEYKPGQYHFDARYPISYGSEVLTIRMDQSDCAIYRESKVPGGAEGVVKDGKKFDPNGYNKVYNSKDELWLDGVFKDGFLYDGKHYIYDSDGILLKMEIWKSGVFAGLGDL